MTPKNLGLYSPSSDKLPVCTIDYKHMGTCAMPELLEPNKEGIQRSIVSVLCGHPNKTFCVGSSWPLVTRLGAYTPNILVQ